MYSAFLYQFSPTLQAFKHKATCAESGLRIYKLNLRWKGTIWEAIEEKAIAFLYEAVAEIQAQTARNSRVDTGQTKGSWDTLVDENKLEGTIGNPLENAIWEELGTGEFALNNNGRKTPWAYKDTKGNWHTTTGKRPTRAFYNAYLKTKPKIKRRAEAIFKELKLPFLFR